MDFPNKDGIDQFLIFVTGYDFSIISDFLPLKSVFASAYCADPDESVSSMLAKIHDNRQSKMLKHRNYLLTHISIASFLWDTDKQCRPRSDATDV